MSEVVNPVAAEPPGDDVFEAPIRERALADLPPKEALALLREGRTLENVRISRLTLTGEFTHPITLRHVFIERLIIEKATFRAAVAFVGCTLLQPRIHRHVMFEAGLNLCGSTLRRANLARTTIHGDLRCDNARFTSTFRMDECVVTGTIRLWEALFEGWVDVSKCEFKGPADFRSLHAQQGVVFKACRFENHFLLRGATIAKKLDFGESYCAQMVDLSKAKLHDFAYLTGIQPGPGLRFAFANAVADRILIQPAQLAGRLDSEVRKDHAAALQEYGLLKRNFEGLHRYEDEDWAFYRFKVNARRARLRTWRRPWTKLMQLADWLLLDCGCGYGTNPFRAVLCAIVLMIGFSLVYMAGIHMFTMEHPPLPDQPPHSLGNRVLFGLVTSVLVFTSGFGGEGLNIAHGWMLLPLMTEALLGTLLWGLFIVAFSRKVIR